MVIGFGIFIVSFGVLLSAKQFPMYLTAMVIINIPFTVQSTLYNESGIPML
jgi:23S rRNA A2030 N6-methylase RlmJ